MNNINGYGITWLVLVVGFCILFYYAFFKKKRRFLPSAFVVAVLFGLFMVIGASFHYLGNWSFLSANKYQFVLSMLMVAGYTLLFYACLSLMFYWMDEKNSVVQTEDSMHGLRGFYEKHTLLVSALVTFVCWMPMLIIFFPGSLPFDGFRQLDMYFGVSPFTNNHPVLATWIMGLFMQLGQLLGSDNYGITLYVWFQSIVCAIIYGLSVSYMRRLKTPFWLQAATILFFGLLPIWGAYAQAEIKDTLFTGIFVLYMLMIVSCLKDTEAFFSKISNHVLFGLITVLLCLLRNESIGIVVFTGVFLFFAVRKKNKLWAAGSLLAVIIIYGLFSNALLPALKIPPGSYQEPFSVPLQQTARYVSLHEKDVTEKEKAAIDAVLDYSQIKKSYDPTLSDPIKNIVRVTATKEQWKTYFSVWYKMFFKHPATYIQATLHNSYGYFYPDSKIQRRMLFNYVIETNHVNTGYFDFATEKNNIGMRKTVEDFGNLAWNVPGVSLLYSTAVYTWILIILFTMLLRKKKLKAMVALVPLIVKLIFNFASPTNLVRYVLPIMAALPLLIAWTMYQTRNNGEMPTQQVIESSLSKEGFGIE
jgi:hypothetical protein